VEKLPGYDEAQHISAHGMGRYVLRSDVLALLTASRSSNGGKADA
jgi:hypothetical protein